MATSAVKKKLVVCGGNGFLGSRICKAATARGWEVNSISRSGEPNWSSVTASAQAPAWSKDVKWHAANILHPSEYKDILKGADAVVHSMGILLEADYKGVLTGKEPIWAGVQKAFSSTKQGTSNPLERKDGENLEPLEEGGQITYEVMNRDTAILLAKESSEASVGTFLYVSAAAGAPVLPGRYITTKRAAETTIQSEFPSMRSIFIRPGFLYDSSRSFTVPLAGLTFAGYMANSLVGGRFQWLMGAGGSKPLKADVVGQAIVEAIADEQTKGIVEVTGIEELATRDWRRGML